MVVELGRIVRSDGEEVYHEDLVIKGERSHLPQLSEL